MRPWVYIPPTGGYGSSRVFPPALIVSVRNRTNLRRFAPSPPSLLQARKKRNRINTRCWNLVQVTATEAGWRACERLSCYCSMEGTISAQGLVVGCSAMHRVTCPTMLADHADRWIQSVCPHRRYVHWPSFYYLNDWRRSNRDIENLCFTVRYNVAACTTYKIRHKARYNLTSSIILYSREVV